VDFREPNENTVPDRFPMQDTQVMLDILRAAALWSTGDFKDAFYGRRICKVQRAAFAFITVFGLFQLNRMGQGARNSPADCQRGGSEIFQDQLWRFLMLFVDDASCFTNLQDPDRKETAIEELFQLLEGVYQEAVRDQIFDEQTLVRQRKKIEEIRDLCEKHRPEGLPEAVEWATLLQHLVHVTMWMQRCRQRRCTLSSKKQKIAMLKVEIIGREVSRAGVSVSAKSVQGILNFPTPIKKGGIVDVKAVQSFLGVAGWDREYVDPNLKRSYAQVTAPWRSKPPCLPPLWRR